MKLIIKSYLFIDSYGSGSPVSVVVAEIVMQNIEEQVIGVRAGGARGAAAPPKFGQLRFFGQQEKIWAKPVFKDVSTFYYYYYYFEEINIFYFNQRSA